MTYHHSKKLFLFRKGLAFLPILSLNMFLKFKVLPASCFLNSCFLKKNILLYCFIMISFFTWNIFGVSTQKNFVWKQGVLYLIFYSTTSTMISIYLTCFWSILTIQFNFYVSIISHYSDSLKKIECNDYC